MIGNAIILFICIIITFLSVRYPLYLIRPYIVDLVFHARLEALLHNLRNGKHFNGKTCYIIRVIEYQFRGLPHAHIVFRLQNGPCHSNIQECITWIDTYICTRMPVLDDNASENDRRHFQLLTDNMMHKCFRGT